MYHFRSNPPCRQVKPVPAFERTYYPLPSVGEPIAETIERKPSAGWGGVPQLSNEQLLDGLARYLRTRPALDEGSVGRLFANNSDLLQQMREGLVLPSRLAIRMSAFVAREVVDA